MLGWESSEKAISAPESWYPALCHLMSHIGDRIRSLPPGFMNVSQQFMRRSHHQVKFMGYKGMPQQSDGNHMAIQCPALSGFGTGGNNVVLSKQEWLKLRELPL